MKLVIDMNLSPKLGEILIAAGHAVVHWSNVGAYTATDEEILAWAREREHVVITHDLDFGAILASGRHACPSVLQVRTPEVTPAYLASVVLTALHQFAGALQEGTLVTIDADSARARLLPLR